MGKQYQSGVYGQRKLSPLQKELSETQTFLATKNMTHLGLVGILYHEAEHSRHTHGVGSSITFSDFGTHLGFGDNEMMTGEAASLLHDIGYFAFCHAGSRYFKEKWGFSHEALAKKKIIEPGEIKSILEKYNVSPELVAELIFEKDFNNKYHGLSRYLKQLVAGDMDVDRLDFLRRDSLTTAPYGKAVDIERLIKCSLRVDNSDLGQIIAFDEDALPAIQAFFSAYFSMYQAVYYNPNVKALEEMFTRSLFLIDDYLQEKFKDYQEDPSMIPESEFKKALEDFVPDPGNVNHHVAKDIINLIFTEQKPIKDAAFLRVNYAPDIELLEKLNEKFPYDSGQDPVDPLETYFAEKIDRAKPHEIMVIRNPLTNHDKPSDVFVKLRNSGFNQRKVVPVDEVINLSSFKKSHRHRHALRILTSSGSYRQMIPELLKEVLD